VRARALPVRGEGLNLSTAEIAPAFPRRGGDDGAATGASQAQDQSGRHPLSGATGPPAGGPRRRGARFRDGELVPLADQESALWDQRLIAEGRAALDRALAMRGRGPYVVQAAIASLHAAEPRDPQIAAL
jgi:Family of unknown function (DUF6596)